MNTHDNACLTPRGREQMVRAVVNDGLSKAAAARRFNTSAKTVAKWVGRFLEDGVDGLQDRSSRPHSSPSQVDRATCDAVETLRRQRYIQAAIAAELGLSPATVSRILKRRGLSLLSSLEPAVRDPATSVRRPARSSISTSRNSAASIVSVTASLAIVLLSNAIENQRSRRAGSTSTSRSTTIPALPSLRSNQVKRKNRPSNTCVPLSPITASLGLR